MTSFSLFSCKLVSAEPNLSFGREEAEREIERTARRANREKGSEWCEKRREREDDDTARSSTLRVVHSPPSSLPRRAPTSTDRTGAVIATDDSVCSRPIARERASEDDEKVEEEEE
jgi:hypothetical protein